MWSFRAWRRRRLLARQAIAEAPWREIFAALPILQRLDAEEQRRLRELTTLLLHEKAINGAGSFEPTDNMRLRIAMLAALPILKLDLAWYDNWHEVVLYPEPFAQEHEWMDEAGVIHHERRELDGESWEQGPIVLAWPEVRTSGQGDGFNLVIHEIAHKLDMQNGDANGYPPLHPGMVQEEWTRIFTEAFTDLCRRVERGEESGIDPYAADAPEEFFAVTSEAFFETPTVLHAAYPEVYHQLRLFYRQDPLTRPTG